MIRPNRNSILGNIGGTGGDVSTGASLGTATATGGNADSVDGQGGAPMNLPHSLVSQQPRKAVNFSYRLVLAATGVPQQFPGLIVPVGLSVTLRGHNGANGNANLVRVAVTQDGLEGGGGRAVTPDTVISFPVDHMGQVWAVGTAGDGLIADVSGVPIG